MAKIPVKYIASGYAPRTRLKKYIGQRVSCRSVVLGVSEKKHTVLIGTIWIDGEGEVCDHLWMNTESEPELAVFDRSDIWRMISFTAVPRSYRKSNYEIQYGLKDIHQVQIRDNGAWVSAPKKKSKP